MATRTWNEITPANSDNINQGAAKIREHKVDIRERMALDHIWNVSAATDGYHNKTTMPDQGSRPATASGYSKIWAEDSGGVSQPYMKDGGGNVRQLGVPVGTICAYLPGYFTAAGNVGYTGVDMTLPDGWVLCDGSAPNDADSPIWNLAARYVPDLDDSRFLCGDTAGNRGTAGGTNTTTAHTATYPNHTHSFTQPTAHVVTVANHSISAHSIQQPMFQVYPHNHAWGHNVLYSGVSGRFKTYNSLGTLAGIAPGGYYGSYSFALTGSYGMLTEWGGYDFYTDIKAQTNCYRSVNVGVGNHTISSHSVGVTNNHSGGAVTSSGGGSVTISNNHSANDNKPLYLNVSYIIKIK